MDDQRSHEALIRVLERTGQYQVFRRVPDPLLTLPFPGLARSGLATGIVVDLETTGLSPDDEPIALGMIRFAFDPAEVDTGTATIRHVTGTFSALREPSRAIPPAVTRLTGLSDADVAGQSIDSDAVAAFVDGASIVIAHNAPFDRPFAERAWPCFASLAWGCSLNQVDWTSEGAEGKRLSHLLAAHRLFHDGHRAIDDCLALLHLIDLPMRDGCTPFAKIMTASAQAGVRIWATGAPFEVKDLLRGRGYKWCDGSKGTPRAWSIEVAEETAATELGWLRATVYKRPDVCPPTLRVTARERFSCRTTAPKPEHGPGGR